MAQDLGSVTQKAEADLQAALGELSALREQIKEEQIPLARELNQIQAQLREKRAEADRSQRLRDNAQVDLGRLRDIVTARRDEVDYLANLVNEYGGALDVRLGAIEGQRYDQQMDRFVAIGNDAELTKQQKLLQQLEILRTGLDRIENLMGGAVFDGQAVAPGGAIENGRYLVIGPQAFFSSQSAAGLALSTGTATPSVIPLGEDLDSLVRGVIQSGQGELPVDVTLGTALAIKREDETWLEHIEAGGFWMIPILGFAIVALLIAIYKAFEIMRVKMPEPGSIRDVLSLLNEGRDAEALERARAVRGPVGAMLVDAVQHADESKELVEEVMYERMLEVQPKLERLLPMIAVTAATAPLLGLLGTVTGMITTFKLITIFGTGDAKSLSSGISEALITTEYGLIVAIPALIMHALLSRRAQSVMAHMERNAVTFINGLSRRHPNVEEA